MLVKIANNNNFNLLEIDESFEIIIFLSRNISLLERNQSFEIINFIKFLVILNP